MAAVEDHHASVVGNLPLEMMDSDPVKVSHWFKGKLDFNLVLPVLKNENLKLKGGRLTSFNNHRVGYALYSLNDGAVSLFVLGENVIDLENKVVTFKDIPFN